MYQYIRTCMYICIYVRTSIYGDVYVSGGPDRPPRQGLQACTRDELKRPGTTCVDLRRPRTTSDYWDDLG